MSLIRELPGQFIETLLISYDHHETRHVLEVVSDSFTYCGKGQRKREFVKWTFLNVSTFKRSLGLAEKWNSFIDHYNIKQEEGAVVFQDIHYSSLGGGRHALRLDLGLSFGSIEFDCESLTLDRRVGVGRYDATIDDFVYADAETGAGIDFYQPFGNFDKEGFRRTL